MKFQATGEDFRKKHLILINSEMETTNCTDAAMPRRLFFRIHMLITRRNKLRKSVTLAVCLIFLIIFVEKFFSTPSKKPKILE